MTGKPNILVPFHPIQLADPVKLLPNNRDKVPNKTCEGDGA